MPAVDTSEEPRLTANLLLETTWMPAESFSSVLIGDESLLVRCGDLLLEHGHAIVAIVTRDRQVGQWALSHAIPVLSTPTDLLSADGPAGNDSFDYLFSVAYLRILPDEILGLPRRAAINFHDGPLPAYAGLNVTTWAILAGESDHGVAWHLMEANVDAGDILAERSFPIDDDETAFSLNAKCYENGLAAFRELVPELASGSVRRKPQLGDRVVFRRSHRPPRGGIVLPTDPPEVVDRLLRALEFGRYDNPVGLARTVDSTIDDATIDRYVALDTLAGRSEQELVEILGEPEPVPPPFVDPVQATSGSSPRYEDWASPSAPHLADLDAATIAGLATIFLGRLSDKHVYDVGLCGVDGPDALDAFHFVVPLRTDLSDPAQSVGDAYTRAAAKVDSLAECAVLHRNVAQRYNGINEVALQSYGAVIDLTKTDRYATGSPLRILVDTGSMAWRYDTSLYRESDIARLQHYFDNFANAAIRSPDTPVAEVKLLDDREIDQRIAFSVATSSPLDPDFLVHGAVAEQSERSATAVAVSDQHGSLTYQELEVSASHLAGYLAEMGVGPGDRVGVCTDRSTHMLVAVLGVLKTGAAYVPLDPTFPTERLTYMTADAELSCVLGVENTRALVELLDVPSVLLDRDAAAISSETSKASTSPVATDAPCYVIYTSGSTGRPKGVVVRHENVGNFFAGMDDVIGAKNPGTWLAVTSLSFDISVLELLWTLARGFQVVLHTPVAPATKPIRSLAGRELEFSLFFFSSHGEAGGGAAYRLLLESTEFADKNGFTAVWTPERHFHAFGGLFPNPSVVSAALAARTDNVQLRSGSCVAPLHHPIRIAEEWAVVDNISGGRVGLGFAAGWQPHDFVLMPQNYESRKETMFDQIEVVKALWRGEKRAFPGHDGEPVTVQTMPRPMQSELPVWITAAGNPETFRQAGEAGYFVLTHLLGQSIDEVAEKVKVYREGRAAGGHDGPGYVSLMLHTFVHPDPVFAKDTVREPLKDYLRSAVDLVKDAAWYFPPTRRRR